MSQPRPAIVEKSPFYELSRSRRIEIAYKPFIRVEGVSLKEFRSQRVEILTHTAVIFTSRTTVDSFFHICEEARITVPETMKYICQTEAVALYLQKYIVYVPVLHHGGWSSMATPQILTEWSSDCVMNCFILRIFH